MTNYSVNLPQTNFPMKANLPEREPKTLEFWQKIDLYQSFAHPQNARGKFILHDGPPYANGEIHLGHAFNKILKDIINKSKLLDGYAVPYIPGWDCHGLPIELNVEKKIGKVGEKVTIEKFIAECRKYAATQIAVQLQSFKRLGVVSDWQHHYDTMDFKYEADIVRSLLEIVRANHVVRGYKPVHWCIECSSALAEAEVEYRDKASPAIDVRFRVVNPEKFKVSNLSIPIWTTTPWTLPANEAVAVHSGLTYALVKAATLNEYFIVVEDLLVVAMQRYGETKYQVEKTYLGSELQGVILQHPFLTEKTVPVILGEHVTVDVGTGAVHTAPAHGQEDYKIGLHYKLPIKNPVGPDGKFLSSTQFFAGLNVFAANPEVIAVLKEHGNLIHAETLQHSYPHCWRHKTPLIFRATKQWFVSMDNAAQSKESLRELAKREIKKVNWVPTQGENSITSMVTLRPDWCISRQRSWGVPVALLVRKESGELHPEMQRLITEIIAPSIEREGIIYWHKLDAVSFLKEHTDTGDANDYEKVTDTLDVWFDSGVTHYCVLKQRQELQVPADLYVEGVDQYRGWFQSSLLTAVAIYGHAPYRAVITHGFTVDADGHKMSKSLGNVITPQEITNKYGADILRLWTAATYLHGDVAISQDILARNVDVYRMLRNTARFLLGNLFDFNPASDLVSVEKMLSLDRFAIRQILHLAKEMGDSYRAYQFHVASSNLQRVLANEISSFYFSVIKDRLYTMAASSLGRRSAQTALFHILEILVRLMAPVLSFTAEEIWQELRALDKKNGITTRSESVFMARWSETVSEGAFDLSSDKITARDWSDIQKIRAVVNRELEKLRINDVIGSSLEAEINLYGDRDTLSVLAKLQDELRFVLITSLATVGDIAAAPATAVTTEISGLRLEVKRSPHKKCARCWHCLCDIGVNHEHPELCSRCVDNLLGAGEKRFMV